MVELAEVLFSDVVVEVTEVTFVIELVVELEVVAFEFVDIIDVVLVVSWRPVEFPDEIVWSAEVVDCTVVVDVLIEEALTDVEFDAFPNEVETVVVEVVVVREDVLLLTPPTNIVLLVLIVLGVVLFTELELRVGLP